MSLYLLALAFFCFFITVYNDRFVSKVSFVVRCSFAAKLLWLSASTLPISNSLQVKVLELMIYRVMPSFQGFDMKLNFINFLALNNEHMRISFTYLHRFDYSTMSLIEVGVNEENVSHYDRIISVILRLYFQPSVFTAFNLDHFSNLPSPLELITCDRKDCTIFKYFRNKIN